MYEHTYVVGSGSGTRTNKSNTWSVFVCIFVLQIKLLFHQTDVEQFILRPGRRRLLYFNYSSNHSASQASDRRCEPVGGLAMIYKYGKHTDIWICALFDVYITIRSYVKAPGLATRHSRDDVKNRECGSASIHLHFPLQFQFLSGMAERREGVGQDAADEDNAEDQTIRFCLRCISLSLPFN